MTKQGKRVRISGKGQPDQRIVGRSSARGYSGVGFGFPRFRAGSSAFRSGVVIERFSEKSQESTAPAQRPAFALWIATAGGVGYAPLAPGTAGAAVGVAVFLALRPLSPALLGLTLLALFALGVWAADAAGAYFGEEDDGRIVVDEVAGQFLSLTPLCWVSSAFSSFGSGLLWVVTGFVLFRVLDIRKPGPVRWAERRGRGGFGVMLDDMVAGALAAAGLWLLLRLFSAGIAAEFVG